MSNGYLESDLLTAVRKSVRQSLATFRHAHPEELVSGYALVTDDDLTTLSCFIADRRWLDGSEDPDFLFCPTDWPYEDSDSFDGIDAQMRHRKDSAPDFRSHVESTFTLLVRVLLDLKTDEAFEGEIFLSVLSSDPSKHLENLANEAISKLNSPKIIQKRNEFLDKWEST